MNDLKMHAKQLFIYNMPGITRDNNFPLIRFDNELDMYAFVTRLKSTSRRSDPTVPYFVLNNPQLLPGYIRNMHVYRRKTTHVRPNQKNDDTDSDSDSDDEYETFDGIFTIYENLDELKRCTIDNNTLSATGFAEEIQKFVW
jgi:hypothetical protein